jgi:hypothetical protein
MAVRTAALFHLPLLDVRCAPAAIGFFPLFAGSAGVAESLWHTCHSAERLLTVAFLASALALAWTDMKQRD